MTRRAAIIGVATIAIALALVGLALLLHSLFTGKGQTTAAAWSPAIQSTSAIALALATIVLVLVTTRYVLLTRHLVALQGDRITPERARKREEATHQLATVLADGVLMLNQASRTYPFKDISTLDFSRLRSTNEMQTFAETLFGIVARLPQDLQTQCRAACDACGIAHLAQSALYETIRRTQMHILTGVDLYDSDPPVPDWNDAKEMYGQLLERGEVWEAAMLDLREGKYIFEAEGATSKLFDDVTNYLATDPTL